MLRLTMVPLGQKLWEQRSRPARLPVRCVWRALRPSTLCPAAVWPLCKGGRRPCRVDVLPMRDRSSLSALPLAAFCLIPELFISPTHCCSLLERYSYIVY